MKVLVTGGNGFIGRWTVAELRMRGYEVMILDHQATAEQVKDGRYAYELFFGDIRDASAVTEAAAHADGIIHLAGVLGTQETIKNPRPAAETNILGGLNVLEAAAQYDLPMVNIAVGNYFENNTYSISKNTVERFGKMFFRERGTRVCSVRAMNAYGPGQSIAAPYGTSKVRKILPSFMMRALHNDTIEIYGDGNQIMDMVYVGDVARDLVDALESTILMGGLYETLESGPGRDTTVNQIAAEVIKATGSNSEVVHIPMRPGETPGVVVKAAKPYGEDYLSLESGIGLSVDYFRSRM